MRKAVLQNFARFFIAATAVANILVDLVVNRSPHVSPLPNEVSVWSFTAWQWVLKSVLLSFWHNAPITVPIGVFIAGLVVGVAVLSEEVGWRHANLLLPYTAYYAGVNHVSIAEPSVARRALKDNRGWIGYASCLLALGVGAGLFTHLYLPVATIPVLLFGLALSIVVAGAVIVSAVGVCTTVVLLVNPIFSSSTSSSGDEAENKAH